MADIYWNLGVALFFQDIFYQTDSFVLIAFKASSFLHVFSVRIIHSLFSLRVWKLFFFDLILRIFSSTLSVTYPQISATENSPGVHALMRMKWYVEHDVWTERTKTIKRGVWPLSLLRLASTEKSSVDAWCVLGRISHSIGLVAFSLLRHGTSGTRWAWLN